MESIYIFVKKSLITEAMINRSTSSNLADLPVYVVSKAWYYFGITDTFCVLEITTKNLEITTIFDNYKWFEHGAALIKIKEFEDSQL